MTVEPFEPRRFRSAAAHYLAGRVAYAPGLIGRVAAITGLTAESRVLDLGCGPGQLAKAFAPYAGEVLGVDPEPEMLRRAREGAPENVQFIEGSSYDLGSQWGGFALVTMGRSFHWMDRAETLRRLDEVIEPGGAVVLFSDKHPDIAENAWWREFRTLQHRYAPEDERVTRRQPGWAGHETVLLDSPFSRLELVAVVERRALSVQDVIDRALSMSSTSPSRIGEEKVAEMVLEIKALLAAHQPDVRLSEVVSIEALIARRAQQMEGQKMSWRWGSALLAGLVIQLVPPLYDLVQWFVLQNLPPLRPQGLWDGVPTLIASGLTSGLVAGMVARARPLLLGALNTLTPLAFYALYYAGFLVVSAAVAGGDSGFVGALIMLAATKLWLHYVVHFGAVLLSSLAGAGIGVALVRRSLNARPRSA